MQVTPGAISFVPTEAALAERWTRFSWNLGGSCVPPRRSHRPQAVLPKRRLLMRQNICQRRSETPLRQRPTRSGLSEIVENGTSKAVMLATTAAKQGRFGKGPVRLGPPGSTEGLEDLVQRPVDHARRPSSRTPRLPMGRGSTALMPTSSRARIRRSLESQGVCETGSPFCETIPF